MTDYIHLDELNNISGFIVNIHDAINFDIDLMIDNEKVILYKNVISNYYSYIDTDVSSDVQIGKTYRCRLKGIGISQNTKYHNFIMNKMFIFVKQLVDQCDGWVSCNLSDIDIYQRLLVDIDVHIGNKIINIKDFLLDKMKDEYVQIFYPYISKNKINI